MSLSREVIRSRFIRENILLDADSVWAGNPDVFLPFDQTIEGFAGMDSQYTEAELETAMLDLVQTGLMESDKPRPPNLLQKRYRITRGGRDFRRAGYPWDRIDEFSGGQRLR